RASPSACSTASARRSSPPSRSRAATSRARRASPASTARRCTTGCASTASSTCCRPRSGSAARSRPPGRAPAASREPRRVRLLFIVDPLDRLSLAGDTSYALMLEAATRGWEVWTCQIEHLGLEGDDAIADACPTAVVAADTPREAFSVGGSAPHRLAAFDAVVMRKDPPLDVNYLHATWILDHAHGKTLLVNDPRGLRELNEHLAVLRFPHLTPPTIVTRSAARVRTFQAAQGGAIVVKPVDGYGGLGIFIVRDGDPNASSILESSLGIENPASRWTIAQKFLPEAAAGDKRIILADGEPVGAVL